MSKKLMLLLACMLLLGYDGVSRAHPMDSPDIVYIDGSPCNAACQSYMAWSRQQMPTAERPAPAREQDTRRLFVTTIQRATRPHRESSKPPAPVRVAKRSIPLPAAQAGLAKQPAPSPATPTPPAKVATLQPSGNSAAAPEPARADVVAPPVAARAAAASPTRPIEQQIAAAIEIAEHVTAAAAAPMSQQDETPSTSSAGKEPTQPAERTSSAPSADTDHLVALLIARPEIKLVSDLASKTVAIEERPSASSAAVRTAIVAAGAAEVELTAGTTEAVDRLIKGEVPAAVLALVSPDAAEWFPDIAGFKVFRVPLSPRSLKAGLDAQ
jgi:hypothetical protein